MAIGSQSRTDGIQESGPTELASHYVADTYGSMTFGAKLRHLLKQHRYSQEAVGKALDVSQGLVSGWCADRYKPDVFQARELAKLLGVSLDFLANEGETEPAPALTSEELQIIDVLRALRLPKDEAIRRLATPLPGSPEWAGQVSTGRIIDNAPEGRARKDRTA